MKHEYVVRIVLFCGINQDDGLMHSAFVECLRYAGLVQVHRTDEKGMCFDLLCPHKSGSDIWAQHNADRMQSFGYNAVKAPKWSSIDPRPE